MKSSFSAGRLVTTIVAAVATATMLIPIQAANEPYSMLLEPGDQVHYDRHYVSTPGSIDLRQVNFTVISHYDDDEVERDWSNSDTSEWPTTNYLDIVVFRDCNVTPCDWENLGVGKTAPGTADQKRRWTRYCCNRQAVYDGRCPNHTLGRLIINESIFAGQRRSVSVPPQQPSLIRLQGDSNISLTTASGMYVLLWANCNEDSGHTVLVTGSVRWRSVYGYLPQDFYGPTIWNGILLASFVVISAWYGHAMYINWAFRVPIQSLIVVAMAVGIGELLIRVVDLAVWNQVGSRSRTIVWSTECMRAIKHGIGNGLLILLSSGWSVVHYDQGTSRDCCGVKNRQCVVLIILVATYVVASIQSRIATVALLERREAIVSMDRQIQSFVLLQLFVAAINVTFGVWMLCAVGRTLRYVRDDLGLASQGKLFANLRRLLVGSMILSAAWMAIALGLRIRSIDTVSESGSAVRGTRAYAWMWQAVGEDLNYLLVWLGVAILFRPNPLARQEYYSHTVPSTTTTIGNDINELEMTVDHHPTGENDDEDDDTTMNRSELT